MLFYARNLNKLRRMLDLKRSRLWTWSTGITSPPNSSGHVSQMEQFRMITKEDRMVALSLGYIFLICYSTYTIVMSPTAVPTAAPERLDKSESQLGEDFRKKRRFVKMTLDQY